MKPKILITRPKSDGKNVAVALEKLGCKTLISPVLSIEPRAQAKNEFLTAFEKPVQALIVTSKHAVMGLAPCVPSLKIPVIAVGTVTAAAAYAQGFTNVHTANGNAQDVIEYIKKHISPNAGMLIHAAGKHLSTDTALILNDAGLHTEKIVTYQARSASNLSPETLQAIKERSLWGATFFSKRSAEIFMKIIRDASLLDSLKHIRAFALSPAIAAALQQDYWHAVYAAAQPAQSALLNVISDQLPPQ